MKKGAISVLSSPARNSRGGASAAAASARLPAVVSEMLAAFGEDVSREGLRDTPQRAAQAMRFLTSGYHMSVEEVLHGALYAVSYDEMVIVKDIELFSLCEHHLLPFFGKCHVAYVPDRKVIGLSKIPRLVDMFARRLQIQERLTTEIAEVIQEAIHPQGVGVVIEARHLCMMMRGVEKQHSQAVSSAMIGVFKDRHETREEFLSLVQGPVRV